MSLVLLVRQGVPLRLSFARVSGTLAFLILALGISCGGGDTGQPSTVSPGRLVPVTPVPTARGTPLLLHTATPHPTFTPVPTQTPRRPTPTVRVADTLTYRARESLGLPPSERPTLVFTPGPTSGVSVPTATPDASISQGTPAPSPTSAGTEGSTEPPTPTPLASIPGDDPGSAAFLIFHTFFPTTTPDLPPSLQVISDIADLPTRFEFVTASAVALHWLIFYDVSFLPDSWVRPVYVRWYNLHDGVEYLMLEQAYDLSGQHDLAFIRASVADPPDGELLWRLGNYRVKLMDWNLDEVLRWDFDVR